MKKLVIRFLALLLACGAIGLSIYELRVVRNTITYPYQLSVCALFQDEASLLKDWIDYHKAMGVEHFWLYNNSSTDNYLEVLQPYIAEGTVELFDWPTPTNTPDGIRSYCDRQITIYNDALRLARNQTKWLAFIDIDEFVVPVQDRTILECLESRYADVVGLGINWQKFGTSHVAQIPQGTRIWDSLVFKAPVDAAENLHYKSIVKTQYAKQCMNPHWCTYKKGRHAVDTNRNPILEGGRSVQVIVDVMYINHYWTGDEWYLHNVKIPRGMKWFRTKEDTLKHAEELNQVYDPFLSLKMKGIAR